MRFFAILISVLAALGANAAQAAPKIFVASSLIDFAEAVAAKAELEVSIVAGGSSILARQIEAGAPAALFVSANRQWAEFAAAEREISPLFANRLVLVRYAPGAVEIEALPQYLHSERLALADPEHVPAGIYAQAALTALGFWNAVESRVVAAENVRSAARFVASGAAAFGVVYASDAEALGLNVAYEFPAESHPPIHYWAVQFAPDDPAVRAFLGFIDSAEGHKLLQEFGFQPIE